MKLTRMTRTAGWLAVAGLLSAALVAPTAASAASVTPTPINEGNPSCGSFNASWTELKVEPPTNGQFTDGTLTITISGFTQSSSGTPGSFDWASNIGVDAVFVKAGSDKHNLYTYNPEATSDTDLGPQAGSGNGISHISFCYDVETTTTTSTTDTSTTETSSTTTSTTDTSTTETSSTETETTETSTTETSSTTTSTTDTSTTETSSTETETTETETTETSTTTTPDGQVEGETATPDVTPPSTDTGSIAGPSSPSGNAWQLLLVAMAGLLATVLLLTPAAEARKR